MFPITTVGEAAATAFLTASAVDSEVATSNCTPKRPLASTLFSVIVTWLADTPVESAIACTMMLSIDRALASVSPVKFSDEDTYLESELPTQVLIQEPKWEFRRGHLSLLEFYGN